MKNITIRKLQFLLVMAVFGCLGPIVRAIGFPSAVTVCLRAWISAIVLILYLFLSKKNFSKNDLKMLIPPMLVCGVLLAGDWIGLFAAYNYTTIATATVCYYITPMLVLLLSPIFLKEHFGVKHAICAVVSFIGMIFVSGVVENGIPSFDEIKGILFALFGAVSYAGIILINKKYPQGDSLLRTTIQLLVAAVLTTPYILLTTDLHTLVVSPKVIFLLLLLGIFLTALIYIAYFRLILAIPARTVSIFSYADPVVAVIISVVFLSEKITIYGIIGSVLIIGAALISEFTHAENTASNEEISN